MHKVRLAMEAQSATAPPSSPAGSLFVGCSGWFYWKWRGLFYPEGLPTGEWFNHYAAGCLCDRQREDDAPAPEVMFYLQSGRASSLRPIGAPACAGSRLSGDMENCPLRLSSAPDQRELIMFSHRVLHFDLRLEPPLVAVAACKSELTRNIDIDDASFPTKKLAGRAIATGRVADE